MTVLLCLFMKALCSIKGSEKYLRGFAHSASLAENAWRFGIGTEAERVSIKEACQLTWKPYIYPNPRNAGQTLGSLSILNAGVRTVILAQWIPERE